MEPNGTVVFTTVGRPYYGFDVFSLKLPSKSNLIDISDLGSSSSSSEENRLTDGISVNFNGSFVDEDQTLVYVSERTGASRIYLKRPGIPKPEQLPSPPESLFQDRPLLFKDGRLFFVSAHEPPADDQPIFFKSWSALYSAALDLHVDTTSTSNTTTTTSVVRRLTPYGCVDYSPAISQSGNFIAVASYGSRPWSGEFHDLLTDIVVFPYSDPTKRIVVCQHGGWPTWSGDSTIYFHRQADDGWWSIYRLDLPLPLPHVHDDNDDDEISTTTTTTMSFLASQLTPPRRVTPPGLHAFTPAAMHQQRNLIAVATRRRDKNYRHIEVFDVDSLKFYPVTESLNPNFHHYNPFVSPHSGFLGYHRFRGESESESESESDSESFVPHLDPVTSPIKSLGMVRLNGSFPSFSPNGDLIAFNHDFDSNSGLKVVKSDGSKRWTLLRDRTAFYNSWSPTEKNVIYTSIGPIFQSVKATVQIARISFDLAQLQLLLLDDDDDVNKDIAAAVDIKILTREDSGNNAFPSCSPDGKSLVFRSGRSGHKNLYIIDAVNGEFNGGLIHQLTEGPWIDTMPSWSADGKLIAFSSNRHNPDNVDAFSIYLIRPDGTDLRRVHVAGSEVDRERINHVCFSADGEWLLFTANLGGVTAEPVSLPNQFQPYGDLYVVRLDGSGLRRLTWNGYENGTPAWHPKLDMGRLSLLECKKVGDRNGDKLRGQFDEPLWIHCDF